MKGVIFFAGMFGATQQYAIWIGEATGDFVEKPNIQPILELVEKHLVGKD